MKGHVLFLYEAPLESDAEMTFGEVGEVESELFSDRKPKIIDHLPGFVGWLSGSRQVAVNEQGVCCEQCERLE